MKILKQRLLWAGTAAVMAAVVVFGLAMMGSALGAKPQELPVAIVNADEGAALPNGERLNAGAMLRERLASLRDVPIRWIDVPTETEAMAGLDEQWYYGALVLPADLSAGLLSAASPEPQPGAVKIVVNEGMNAQGGALARHALGTLTSAFRTELTKRSLSMAGAASGTGAIPAESAVAMLTPFEVQEVTVHPVGANQGNGSAPGMLVQIMWIGAMLAGIVLFMAGKRARAEGAGRWTAASMQVLLGVAIAAAAAGLLLWSATAWYGMEVRSATEVWLLLSLAGGAFFLLIAAGLHWLGLPAVGLAALLMFFSMPVVNLAPEFLPEATRDWLYGWTPLQLAAQHLRTALYFEGGAAGGASALWWIAGAGLLAVLGAVAKPERKAERAAPSASNA